jgi:hypothetical protein
MALSIFVITKKIGMAHTIQFLTDGKGRRKSALVPIKAWDELNLLNKQLQKKLEVLTGIASGLEEVKASRQSGRPLQTLSDFLSES